MKFQKGQSGNPAGRPKGSKSVGTLMVEALAADLPELLEKTKEAALGGDMVAMRLLLERSLPVRKQSSAPIDLPAMKEATNLTEKAGAVLDAIADGSIPPDVGAQLMTAISTTARVAELDALADRIRNVENKLGLAERVKRARERVQRGSEHEQD